MTILSPQNRACSSTSVPSIFTTNASTSWIGYSLDEQANAMFSKLLPPFKYRKSHIINSAPGAGTDYQVKIVVWRTDGTDDGGMCVHIGTNCRTDFGDIARMHVPKMVKNGFNSVLHISASAQEDSCSKKLRTGAKPKTFLKSGKANKSHFRPISEQACALSLFPFFHLCTGTLVPSTSPSE